MTAPVPFVSLLIAWLLLPYLGAFLAALLPRLGRWLALLCCLATAAAALVIASGASPESLALLGPYGVVLQPDALAVPALILNALVCGAVLLECWQREQPGPFLLLLMVLHGGLNTAFVCADLVSLYVTLEVVGISAFLLILLPRTDRTLWVALRYLLVGNTVMTLYLIGAALVFQQTGSFAFEPLGRVVGAAPLALLLVGLLTKSGLFLSGLWLPRTHAEAPAEISALLSGVVVAGGALPLLRLALAVPSLQPVLALVGVASATLGLLYALAESDAKRLLAWSTLSQMGLVVIAPATGAGYLLAHGLAKAALFLLAPRWPSRDLLGWRERPLPRSTVIPLWIASLSICGLPPLLGWTAKEAVSAGSDPVPALFVTVLSVGTVAVYARLWGSPFAHLTTDLTTGPSWSPAVVLLAVGLLLGGLLVGAEGLGPQAFGKAGLTLLLGVALDRGLGALRRPDALSLPERPRLPDLERFTDLVGGMGLVGAGLLVMLSR